MMPNQAPPVGPPMGGPPQEGGQANPEQIKQKLVQLLQEAKKIAEANGIDFAAIVQQVAGGGGSRPSAPPPPMMG